jgi:fused signal recognition particle receptor
MFNRLRRLDESVRRSRDTFFNKIGQAFDRRSIDDALWDELEELLVQADVGLATTEKLLKSVRERVRSERVRESDHAKAVLKQEMVRLLSAPGTGHALSLVTNRQNVVLVVGVNGTGKTTSVAKLAAYLQQRGHRVILGAADTFRAAAIDQLRIWGERTGVTVIAHQPGADPSAVVFDALQAAKARNADVLLLDTAGRLHTKVNLMEELKKIRRVLNKLDPTAPHDTLLVLDATTGQNAISQARTFMEAVGVSGVILAKLDGTAKGGVVFSISDELRLPIIFVGTGEKIEDLTEFDAEDFVNALVH